MRHGLGGARAIYGVAVHLLNGVCNTLFAGDYVVRSIPPFVGQRSAPRQVASTVLGCC